MGIDFYDVSFNKLSQFLNKFDQKSISFKDFQSYVKKYMGSVWVKESDDLAYLYDYFGNMILEKDNAVEDFRKLIGATDPAEAAEGTIRKYFAESKGRNAVHGSDSDENAAIEGAFHFSANEVF